MDLQPPPQTLKHVENESVGKKSKHHLNDNTIFFNILIYKYILSWFRPNSLVYKLQRNKKKKKNDKSIDQWLGEIWSTVIKTPMMSLPSHIWLSSSECDAAAGVFEETDGEKNKHIDINGDRKRRRIKILIF